MLSLIRRLHIYAGLLVFAQLIVYGIAGLVATVQLDRERPKPIDSIRHEPFTAQPSATDKQVAAAVYQQLRLPLTRPMPDWFLQHTAAGDLQLDFYNINGIYRVIVLEREGRLRIESIRNSLGFFLGDIHAATPGDEGAPGVLRAWAIYNEFAMWMLLAFCTSGVYLWLATRPRDLWAWAALAAGIGLFAALYVGVR